MGSERGFRIGQTITLTPREAFGDVWPDLPAGDPVAFVITDVNHGRSTITIANPHPPTTTERGE